jgi:hypothetical protein
VPGQPFHEQQGPIGFPPVQRPQGHGRSYQPVDPNVPGGYPPFPQFDDCMVGLRALLEETLLNAVAAPHHEPPFNARSVEQTVRAVINVPAAFDAAANAAGIALAAAEGVIVTVPVLTPALAVPPFGAVQVLALTTPGGHVTVYRKVGVLVQNSRPEAARVEVVATGPNASPDAPTNLSSGILPNERRPILAIVPENRELLVRVENLDTASPILVTVVVEGWTLPVTRFTDDLRGLYPRMGFGRNACPPSWTQKGRRS